MTLHEPNIAHRGPARRASILIFCLGLAALVVVAGFGFFRGIAGALTAGNDGQIAILAQEAARAGTVHATQAAAADYAAATLQVGSGAGTAISISRPPTFLDGPYRAPFLSHLDPNGLGLDVNDPASDDDLKTENIIFNAYGSLVNTWQWIGTQQFRSKGDMVDPTRGRWHEVGYTNVSRPLPTGAAPVPVTTIRFTDAAAAVPEWNEGCFLDRNFRRLATGDPVTDRLRARFRLRYAVSVTDLQGQLLMNPLADMDPSWNGGAGYRAMPAGLRNAQHAWNNFARLAGGTAAGSLRAEHVFIGRGSASNADRDPATGYPVAFPYMFRTRTPTNGGFGSPPWWGFFSDGKGLAMNSSSRETEGLLPYATAAGGAPLDPSQLSAWPSNSKTLMHIWTGPQFSWLNAHVAMQGALDGDGNVFDGSNSSIPAMISTLALPTPFGHRLVASAAPSATWKWYEGRVDSPWHVNLLTASPRTVQLMLYALLPPAAKSLRYTKVTFLECTGQDLAGNLQYAGLTAGPFTTTAPVDRAVGGRDLWTSLAGSALSEFPPPASADADPDFQAPDLRTPAQRYPGQLMNLNDDLGKDIDVDTIPLGRCSHTGIRLFPEMSNTESHLRSDGTDPLCPPASIPAWWSGKPNNKFVWSLDPSVYKVADSYWWDVITAFSSAASIVKAQWAQYNTAVLTPTTAFFPASSRNPALYADTAAIDRVFLRQLGEDPGNPGSGTPVAGVRTKDAGTALTFTDGGFTAKHSIRSLRDAGLVTPAGAAVMERVLNDVRLSLLGSGPTYSETFRPLDFDRDGRVQCSGYISNGAASAAERTDGIDHWLPADATTHQGPQPSRWFCLSGCFFIGKSRFYRILSRGEVYDNLSRCPIADATQESVVVLDPDGPDAAGRASQPRVIYQRWQRNYVSSHLPRHQR